MRVHVVDPPAFTPPYDHALSAALARAGVDVTLVTGPFAYGAAPPAAGYAVEESFYARGRALRGRARSAARLAQHVPGMLRYRARAAAADVVHFQWLGLPQLDACLLPRGRPLVLTGHDVLPHEPRPGQTEGQRRIYAHFDAVVVHSEHGRERLLREAALPSEKVTVIPHGAFTYLLDVPGAQPLPAELAAVEVPVVLLFGLMRPYKGIDVALEAWRGFGPDPPAELWVVGMPRMDTAALRANAPPGVRFVERFVDDTEVAALFERADVVVLPYRKIDQSGVLFTALAFARPLVLSDVGGFPEIAREGAARLVPPGDPHALLTELRELLSDDDARAALAGRAAALAAERHDWDAIARAHLDLYGRLAG